jgi:dephospho-CoA kinase
MKVIGLTGSIAAGKSEVAKIFRSQDIPVFDSDAEVHALYASKEGADLLRNDVPTATVGNHVDRKILTECVMKDKTLLSRLEQKVHGEIRRRRDLFLQHAKAGGAMIAVVDVPLLFETGADKHVDLTLVISTTEENQRRRVLDRPGMTVERLEMILKRQMPDAEKRKRANHVIDNNGSVAELAQKVQSLINQLKADEV